MHNGNLRLAALSANSLLDHPNDHEKFKLLYANIDYSPSWNSASKETFLHSEDSNGEECKQNSRLTCDVHFKLQSLSEPLNSSELLCVRMSKTQVSELHQGLINILESAKTRKQVKY